ncbi:hypothetical protein V8C37DRAFT_419584 [Trichoderma ceciliae]
MDLLWLLQGVAHGWEVDATDVQSDEATSNLGEETQSPINQKIQDPYDKMMQADPYYDDQPGSETQWDDADYYYETPMERQMREEQSANATYLIGTYTYTRCTTPISNGTTYSPNVPDISVSEKEKKEKKAPTRHGKREIDSMTMLLMLVAIAES